MKTPTFHTEHDGLSDDPDNLPPVFIRDIKDPIHDIISVTAKLSRFIDTKQFQRLRNIKQLGTTHYVWPGATHTRFEHSLGVAYLARVLATHLKTTQPELHITNRDVDCVEIAGLCHDLGHGPWSHVWDGLFIPKALPNLEKRWTHENGSEMMFDSLVHENNIPISLKDQLFVKALIAGDHSRTPDERAFLFDIVANKRNGLDVDKFDYIYRDSHMIGEPIQFSLLRVLKSARVRENQLCYDIKDANHIYEICSTRFKLHKLIYNHKVARAIEYMIIDALLAAEPFLKIAEHIFDPKRYLYLTDDIMARIESSEEPELAEARAILDRIHTRDLYKSVDNKNIEWPMRNLFHHHITEKSIVDSAPAMLPSSDEGSKVCILKVEDVIVDFSTMHFGMKEKNPLDFIKFYSKRNPNQCAKAERGDYSSVMPEHFAEDLLRVYTKKPEFFGRVQAGYRSVLASLADHIQVDRNDNIILPAMTTNADPMVPTPPSSEAPSTPKVLSRDSSFTLIGKSGSGTTPFSNNSFTTVPPSFVPTSPTQANRRLMNTVKRQRDELPGILNMRVSKKRKE